MLVEDDKSLREIYGVRLQAEGYDIKSAGDGEEALAMAIKERPDLILADVMMPKISGFDMLDILRSTPETKAIKVIMMTALSSEDQRARGESLGADRYLVKSQVGIEDVVRTIHEVLGDAPASAPVVPTTAMTTEEINAYEPPALEPAPAPAAMAAPTMPAPVPLPEQPQPVITPEITIPEVTMPEPVAPFSTPAPESLINSMNVTPVATESPVATVIPEPTPIPEPVVMPDPTPMISAEPIPEAIPESAPIVVNESISEAAPELDMSDPAPLPEQPQSDMSSMMSQALGDSTPAPQPPVAQ